MYRSVYIMIDVKCSHGYNKEMWWLDTDRIKVCDDWNNLHQQRILQISEFCRENPFQFYSYYFYAYKYTKKLRIFS